METLLAISPDITDIRRRRYEALIANGSTERDALDMVYGAGNNPHTSLVNAWMTLFTAFLVVVFLVAVFCG